jgi:prepilin-type N-terminal cleavage/methylation domain-containing protein
MKNVLKASNSGFTLVELVVTIAVGAIFAISVTTLVSENAHLARRSRDLIAANSYVEGKVEELRSIGYAGLSLGTTDITAELPSELNSSKTGSLQISIPVNGLKQADITIQYNDQSVNRTYSYTTYIGELGVGQY